MFEELNNQNRKMDVSSLNTQATVKDLVTVLRELSNILALANSRNPELSISINKLANVISRYKDKPLDDVISSLTLGRRVSSTKTNVKPRKIVTESEAKSLTLEQIEKLLTSEDLSKADLTIIASVRFGISKAEVKKTKREIIIEEIKTAISNQRTIEIIGNEASGKS
jgi:hypothetical protein